LNAKSFSIIALALFLAACSPSVLPEKRPADLTIISRYGTGGMTADPYAYTIYLSEKQSFYQRIQNGETKKMILRRRRAR